MVFRRNLLGAGVLSDGLSALTDGVLGQFTGQQQTNSGLNLATGDGRPLVVVCQTGSLGGNTLEDIVDETVHDAHGLAGDTSVRVDLLQHLVDVDSVALLTLTLVLLLIAFADILLGLSSLLHCLSACFRCHLFSEYTNTVNCLTNEFQTQNDVTQQAPPLI